jgi:hypothetical protein
MNWHKYYVSKEEIMSVGLTAKTKSNLGPSVGLGNPMFKDTPYANLVDKPIWLKFENAIPCWLEKPKGDYVCFPDFTDKIMVFNEEISYQIVQQEYYELLEGDEEQYAFYTGRNLKELYSEYWGSMMTLEDYLKHKPYPESEVLIFEDIPPKYLHASSSDK